MRPVSSRRDEPTARRMPMPCCPTIRASATFASRHALDGCDALYAAGDDTPPPATTAAEKDAS
jgi:hypothetical protein